MSIISTLESWGRMDGASLDICSNLAKGMPMGRTRTLIGRPQCSTYLLIGSTYYFISYRYR